MNPSTIAMNDDAVRVQLMLFLAKLGVYYRYETFAMGVTNFANNVIPDGAIYLPVIDVRMHCLVPMRRKR